ncbi:MAG: hypothetical protein ACR2M4_13850 [Actinomycetota bacterium]
MGRRSNLPDHGWKVHGIKECFSKAEAEALRKKYGFRRKGRPGFHRALNVALSWHDTFRDWEERPANESIEILLAVHKEATSLRVHLDKSGADKLLCVHHEVPAADPFMGFRYPTDTRVLVALEARCRVWPAPAKRLRQDIGNASERLRDALSKCGVEELRKMYPDGGKLPSPADIPSALDWLIHESARAAKQIEHDTRWHKPDSMPNRKPRSTAHRLLINKLWELFRWAKPEKADTIRWDRATKRYAGTFYEFVREIFPKAGICLSGGRIGNLVKGVKAARAAAAISRPPWPTSWPPGASWPPPRPPRPPPGADK